MARPNAQLTELCQYIEDLGVGLAMRFDDLDRRLDAIESDLAAIKARTNGPQRIDPQVVASHTGLTLAQSRVAIMLADGKHDARYRLEDGSEGKLRADAH